jgi:SAM-dependent methyltransferase
MANEMGGCRARTYDGAVPEDEYGDPDAFYSRYYQQVLCTGVVGSAQARTHKALERHAGPDMVFPRVLEVGAGNGEHFPYVRHSFDEYVETDMRQPVFPHPDSDPRRRFEVADAQALPFRDTSFDRVIATCLLLHLPEPETALAEWRRVVRPGGMVSMLVPCDPGVLVRFTREVLTVPAVRRSGFQGYKLFNARDHRNHAGAIDQLVRYVFQDDRIATYRFPLRVNSWNLNAFSVYTVVRSR